MIVINVDKARNIAHDLRRAARAKEFAPYDDVIVKQIPGALQEAEPARQAIREKYAVIQTQLDAATTLDEMKSILGL